MRVSRSSHALPDGQGRAIFRLERAAGGNLLVTFSPTTQRNKHCTQAEKRDCDTESKFFSEPRPTIELDNDHQDAAQKYDDATNK